MIKIRWYFPSLTKFSLLEFKDKVCPLPKEELEKRRSTMIHAWFRCHFCKRPRRNHSFSECKFIAESFPRSSVVNQSSGSFETLETHADEISAFSHSIPPSARRIREPSEENNVFLLPQPKCLKGHIPTLTNICTDYLLELLLLKECPLDLPTIVNIFGFSCRFLLGVKSVSHLCETSVALPPDLAAGNSSSQL